MRYQLYLGLAAVCLFSCGSESGGASYGDLPRLNLPQSFEPDPSVDPEAASVRAGGYVELSSSGNHTCALRMDGTLWCWGENTSGQIGVGDNRRTVDEPTRVGGEGPWSQVSAGREHTCAIQGNQLYCWGYNVRGAVGDGTTFSRFTPRLVPGTGWTDVSAGTDLTCGIQNGALFCWGSDWFGRLTGIAAKDGATGLMRPHVVDKVHTWKRVVTGTDAACALTVEGAIWCWGEGAAPTTGPLNAPQRLGTDVNWMSLHLVRTSVCASKATGSLWCWSAEEPILRDTSVVWRTLPRVSDDHFCGVTVDGHLSCGGNDDWGQLGNGLPREFQPQTVPVGDRTDWTAVVTGAGHTCALNSAGELWCWGSMVHQEAGLGVALSRSVPGRVGDGWSQVGLGLTHTCGIKNGKVWCWGSGQDYPESGLTFGTPQETSLPAAQVAVSRGLGCALQAGQPTCWGSVALDKTQPLPTLQSISVGTLHACGVGQDASLYCWGGNSDGQLGDGTTIYAANPEKIGMERWQAVSAGDTSSCGITLTGKLFCWGAARYLGVAIESPLHAPNAVLPEFDFVGVSVGAQHACAIKNDQSLWCWGNNLSGAGSTGYYGGERGPVRLGADFWKQVSVSWHACGVSMSGALFCWGQNSRGQLGNPQASGASLPTQVGTATDWTSVTSGPEHTCALNQAGELYCWGDDSNGQLGNREPFVAEPTRVWPR